MSYEEKVSVLRALTVELSGELLSFEYFKKIFGNMIVKIKKDDIVYTFITDKGEIYCNDSFICDSSYHKAGQDDTFIKLLEIVKQCVV